MSSTRQPSGRKIHVNLTEEVHRKLRIKCAIEDTSMQEYVSRLIADSVARVTAEEASATKRRS